MKIKLLLIVFVAILGCATVSLAAKNINIETLFNLFTCQENAVSDLFDASFLAQVSPSKIIEILHLYKKQLGSLIDITGRDGKYT